MRVTGRSGVVVFAANLQYLQFGEAAALGSVELREMAPRIGKEFRQAHAKPKSSVGEHHRISLVLLVLTSAGARRALAAAPVSMLAARRRRSVRRLRSGAV